MDEKRRAEFEAAITRVSLEAGFDEPNLMRHLYHGKDMYADSGVQAAWWGWQASRAALVVKLPEKISQYNTDDTGFVSPAAAEHDEAIDDCRDAIEAAGVRVKQ